MRILITRDDPAAMARGMALVKLYTDDDEVLCEEVPEHEVDTLAKCERFVREFQKSLLKAHGARWIDDTSLEPEQHDHATIQRN